MLPVISDCSLPVSPSTLFIGYLRQVHDMQMYMMLLDTKSKMNPNLLPAFFYINMKPRKSILNIHWKDWCWSSSSNTFAAWCEDQTHWKRSDAGKDWRQKEKRATEDETVGWHHWCNGRELGQTLGDGEGQRSLECCNPLGSWRVRHDLVTEQQHSLLRNI